MPASRRMPSISIRRLGLVALLTLAALVGVQTRALAQQDSTDEQWVRGARLYKDNCAACHGPNGEGRIGATLAKDWPSIRPDLTVRTIIENGVPGSPMPAWSQVKGGPLSESEIDALVYYILSWQSGGAPQITPQATATSRPPITPIPEVQGDPNKGAVIFDENCAMCHGANGEGRIGATLAKVWPSIRPDLAIKTTVANGVSGSPMPAWSQAKGGPLSESEIDDLVAFILTWEGSPIVQVQPTQAPAWTPSALSGWAGVFLFVVLLGAILVAAALLQRKRTS